MKLYNKLFMFIIFFLVLFLTILLKPIDQVSAQCSGVWYEYRTECITRDTEPPYLCLELGCAYNQPVNGPYSCIASYPGGSLSCNPGSFNGCGVFQNKCETPPQPPQCGNGNCQTNQGEDCSSCPQDCGACPGGGGSAGCGASCTQNSDCNIAGATNPACVNGICWDACACGGQCGGGGCNLPPPEVCPDPGPTICGPCDRCVPSSNPVWYTCENDGGCGAYPQCTVTLTPDPVSVAPGGGVGLTATVVQGFGWNDCTVFSNVTFESSNGSIATVNPTNTTGVYVTQVTGVGPGSTTVTAKAYANYQGGLGINQCGIDTVPVNVVGDPQAWWQVRDADVVAGGSLTSLIPSSCTGSCIPRFDLDGVGGFPGVPIYAGASYDFAGGSPQGTVSTKNWIANTSYQGRTYSYNYFESLIPSDVVLNEITTDTINGGDLNSGGTPSRGYVWYHRAGNLTINGNVNLVGTRKAILLVDGGDLNINGRINLQDENGFFMAIVGKDAGGGQGNIIVDPSVSHPTLPELQGIYMADGQFRTGASTNALHIKGSVAAWGGVVFERDLEAANDDTPAEYIEYDPVLFFTFPRELSRRAMIWREINP